MRIGVVCVALLVGSSAVTGWGQSKKNAKAETIARWQFVGTRQLSAQSELTALRDVINLPQTRELRDLAAQGFALQMAQRFTQTPDTNANAHVASLIKTLLPDIVESESSLEISTLDAQNAEWYLSINLPPERISEWDKNLKELAGSARMQVKDHGNGAWSAERDSYRLSATPGKDSFLLEGSLGTVGEKRDRSKKRMGKDVLRAEVNFPRIAELWKMEGLAHAPKLNLVVAPRKDLLRSEMDIEYPRSLNIKPERWDPPLDQIHDPLVGFTAVQGIGGALSRSDTFSKLGAQKTPNQAYAWSLGGVPFAIFFAADVGNPATVVSNIAAGYVPQLRDRPGKINVLTNRPGIVWRGLPGASPFVEAAESGNSPILIGGLFPLDSKNAKPAPAQLIAQLKKRKLVYYDWEITQERLKQWRAIWQFAQIVRGKWFPSSVSDRWIDGIMPLLGNTVTEVTLEKDNRLKLVRTSQAGLSAIELVLLAHALDPNDVSDRPPRASGQPGQRRPNSLTPTKKP